MRHSMPCPGACLLVLAGALLGCTRPGVFVDPRPQGEAKSGFHGAAWDIGKLDRLEAVPRYEPAIRALFGSALALQEAFPTGLQPLLPPKTSGARLRLSLDRLVIDGYRLRGASDKGIDRFPGFRLSDVEFCEVSLHFRVLDSQGAVLREGMVRDQASSESLAGADEARLQDALQRVRTRLVEHLTGRAGIGAGAVPSV